MTHEAADASAGLAPIPRLLCTCAARAGEPGNLGSLPASFLEHVDWANVPPLLVRHGLAVLGSAQLAAVSDRIPPSVWSEIQGNALLARATGLAMARELLRLLAACADRRLRVLPYKGPLLAWEAYGDLGARPFVDLDLLCAPGDVDPLLEILRTDGYAALHRFSPARDAWFRRVDGDYQMVHERAGTLLEVHTRALSLRLEPGPAVDVLWERRRSLTVSGQAVPVPGADDQLYLQFIHGAKHRWERLEWVAATGALLRRRGGNIGTLTPPAYPAARAVALGCLLAHDLVGAPLDPAIARAVAQDSTVRRLAVAATRHLFAGHPEGDRVETAAKLWFNLRLQRGIRPRLRFLYRWIAWPSPEDWTAVSLPDPLFVFYRLIRPFRLLVRYLGPARSRPRSADG